MIEPFSARGDDYFTLDLRTSKVFKFGELLEVLWEMFNVFENLQNLGGYRERAVDGLRSAQLRAAAVSGAAGDPVRFLRRRSVKPSRSTKSRSAEAFALHEFARLKPSCSIRRQGEAWRSDRRRVGGSLGVPCRSWRSCGACRWSAPASARRRRSPARPGSADTGVDARRGGRRDRSNRRILPFDVEADRGFRGMWQPSSGRRTPRSSTSSSRSSWLTEFKGWGEVENGGNWELGPPEVLEDLKAIGFDLMNRANNHSTDYGVEGLRLTNQLLDRLGIVHAGTGLTLGQAKPARLPRNPQGPHCPHRPGHDLHADVAGRRGARLHAGGRPGPQRAASRTPLPGGRHHVREPASPGTAGRRPDAPRSRSALAPPLRVRPSSQGPGTSSSR